jgi:hypothetical protein
MTCLFRIRVRSTPDEYVVVLVGHKASFPFRIRIHAYWDVKKLGQGKQRGGKGA